MKAAAILIMVLFGFLIFWLIGYQFGDRDGYRRAQKAFEAMLDKMRADEKELEEECRKLDKQISEIEKIGFGKVEDGAE